MNLKSQLEHVNGLVEHYKIQCAIPKGNIAHKMDTTALKFYRNERKKLKAEIAK